MTRPDDGMVDVELVDDTLGVPDDAPGRAAPVERRRSGATGQERHRRRLVGAALLLVAGAAAGGSLRTAADPERLDAPLVAVHADVDGIAPSLREPPVERWRTTGPATLLGDLVLTHEVVDGALRLVAHEAATGEVRWATSPYLDRAGLGVECLDTAADGALLLCEIPGGLGQSSPNADAVLRSGAHRLVALRTSDGHLIRELGLDGRTIGWAAAGDDVVVAQRDGTTVHLTRTVAADGRTRWRSAVELPAGVRSRQMRLTVDDALVVLTGPVAHVLDATAGEPVGTWAAPPDGHLPVRVATSSTGIAVWPTADGGVWSDRTGRAGALLPGALVAPDVDDGSAPQVLLLRDGDVLRAVDVHQGVLWERREVDRAAIRLAGTLVVLEGDRLTSIDVLTGEVRWSVAVGDASLGVPVVTDGVRVLVVRSERAGAVVTAHDLRDGARIWTAPVPDRVVGVSVGGGLLVRLTDGVAVYG